VKHRYTKLDTIKQQQFNLASDITPNFMVNYKKITFCPSSLTVKTEGCYQLKNT